MTQRVGCLLDFLPARGPVAFDEFCNALLECDHTHVAEYLKTMEATAQFREDIQPHCDSMSETTLEKFVSIFRRSTPHVQRFAERKFEMLLKEQEEDLQIKEQEVKELDNQNLLLSLEVSQLRSFLNTCFESSEAIAIEVERSFVSRTFLREETLHLENLKDQLKGLPEFNKICQFYSNMQTLLKFLETFAGPHRVTDHPGSGLSRKNNCMNFELKKKVSLMDKFQNLIGNITKFTADLVVEPQVSSATVRWEMDEVLNRLNEILNDVSHVKDVFKSTLKQKRKLEYETLSLLHNFREVRRLEREVKEKKNHIAELSKHGQLIKRKTKHHRKELEQIQISIQQKKVQLHDVQTTLERQLGSADQRLHSLLSVLPDLEEHDGYLLTSDTDSPDSSSVTSRTTTPCHADLSLTHQQLRRQLLNQSAIPSPMLRQRISGNGMKSRVKDSDSQDVELDKGENDKSLNRIRSTKKVEFNIIDPKGPDKSVETRSTKLIMPVIKVDSSCRQRHKTTGNTVSQSRTFERLPNTGNKNTNNNNPGTSRVVGGRMTTRDWGKIGGDVKIRRNGSPSRPGENINTDKKDKQLKQPGMVTGGKANESKDSNGNQFDDNTPIKYKGKIDNDDSRSLEVRNGSSRTTNSNSSKDSHKGSEDRAPCVRLLLPGESASTTAVGGTQGCSKLSEHTPEGDTDRFGVEVTEIGLGAGEGVGGSKIYSPLEAVLAQIKKATPRQPLVTKRVELRLPTPSE